MSLTYPEEPGAVFGELPRFSINRFRADGGGSLRKPFGRRLFG